MKNFVAGPNEEGVRLSRFVEGVTHNMPKSLLYKAFRNKRVKVNGKKQDPDYRIRQGDLLELYINDEFFPAQPQKAPPKKRQPKVQVIWEDENIAILYKPTHLLCHSDRTGDPNLVDAFRAYLEEKGEYDPHAPSRFAPAICNRLDRGTEGLVIAAKNYPSLRDMNAIIQQDLLNKTYLTITFGFPPEGRHTAYLWHNEKTNKVTVRKRPAEGYKEILTQVKIEEKKGPFALCRIGLITGRTHQIRAHLAYLNAPVLGDIKYGNRTINEKLKQRTQNLCAVKIAFKEIPQENTLHYLTGQVFKLPSPAILEKFHQLEG